jgi:hypothetical protein
MTTVAFNIECGLFKKIKYNTHIKKMSSRYYAYNIILSIQLIIGRFIK